jgi:hypothetical protein
MCAAMSWAVTMPADAAFKSSGITYTGDKSVRCANGKYGFMYAAGNHVSYKKVYWKQNGATHWSNTQWTGFNGGDVLVKVLPKSGGARTSRAYFGLAPDTKHGMTAKSRLNWRLLCDSRDLSRGPNVYNTNWDLRLIWSRSTWRTFR